ncbi:MAG TPA: hypothetical protein VEI07_26510 [Planctomycetaceae bacterium]|nr:hypothetical protein [Planctomycetaceae bacterium]
MPPLPLDARPKRIRTRLEASLIRLQAALRRGIQREATDETLYAEWQNRWSGRREELSRRLTAIDSQLDSWAHVDAPRLAVIAEADEPSTGLCDETGFGPFIEID